MSASTITLEVEQSCWTNLPLPCSTNEQPSELPPILKIQENRRDYHANFLFLDAAKNPIGRQRDRQRWFRSSQILGIRTPWGAIKRQRLRETWPLWWEPFWAWKKLLDLFCYPRRNRQLEFWISSRTWGVTFMKTHAIFHGTLACLFGEAFSASRKLLGSQWVLG